MLIHFPIVLLLLGAAVRVSGLLSGGRQTALWARRIIYAGAVSAVAATVAGFAFAASDEWHGAALRQLLLHRSLALATTTLALAAAGVERWLSGGRLLGLLSLPLVGAAALVAATGHVGGLLVFGEDHFSSLSSAKREGQDTSRWALSVAANDRPVDFVTEVRPILERSCFRCHDTRRQKGQLILEDRDTALRGGKSGPALIPGDPMASLLYQAIILPREHDGFMPTEGTPLTAAERHLIGRWIQQGASWPSVE